MTPLSVWTIVRSRSARIAWTLLWCTSVPAAQSVQETVQPSQDQRFEVRVNLVTLRFTVRDAQGRFVNNLGRERFTVYENQRRQRIDFFQSPHNKTGEPGPLWLAFLLDVSGSTFGTRSEEIIAAQTFFDNVYEFTQLGIFGFTDRLLTFQDFTTSREVAVRAFASARRHLGQTAIYDSLSELITRLNAKAKGGDRKIVIVVSDSMDKAVERSAQVVAVASSSNVRIYTILVPSASQLYIGTAVEANDEASASNGAPAKHPEQEQAFARLSMGTGGKHFAGYETILDFDNTLALINDDVYGNLYELAYYTEDPYLDRRQRQIRVELDRSDLKVSALFQNVPERLSAKKKFIAALFDNEALSQLPADLKSSLQEIGAELDVLPTRREGGQIGLPFRIKISPYSLRLSEKEGLRTQFGVIGTLLDRRGREVVRLREFFRATLSAKELREGRGIIYTNKLFAPAGAYQLRLAVLELASWRVTAFDESVRITEDATTSDYSGPR